MRHFSGSGGKTVTWINLTVKVPIVRKPLLQCFNIRRELRKTKAILSDGWLAKIFKLQNSKVILKFCFLQFLVMQCRVARLQSWEASMILPLPEVYEIN